MEALAAPGANTQYYVGCEGASGAALLQHFDEGAQWADLRSLPATGSVAARYAARLISDTGTVAELAPILMIVAFEVPAANADEVERWYAEEHIPMLMRAPGWLRARRFETITCSAGPKFTSIALHDLRNLEVLGSEERRLARSTAWRARLEPSRWFQQAGRFVYRRIAAADETELN
jgi:hypothetical protein